MSKLYKNKVIIDNDIVIKKRNDKLISLYDYLDERGFNNHPDIIDVKKDTIETKFINKSKNYELIKGSSFIKTVSLLHNNLL